MHYGLLWRFKDWQKEITEILSNNRIPTQTELANIRYTRELLGLGLKEVGQAICKTSRTVQKLEAGSGQPRSIRDYLNFLEKTLVSINVQPGEVLGWIDPPLAPSWGTRSPLALLDPERRIVPLHGEHRKSQLTNLRDWCESDQKVSIRTVIGAGGTGKTRLGVELCRAMLTPRSDGCPNPWIAGFLSPHRFSTPWGTSDLRSRDLLIVADYAGRPQTLAVLKNLIPHLIETPARRVRLLLLDRRDFWLSQLHRSSGYDTLVKRYGVQRQIERMRSPYDGTSRREVFRTARLIFREKLQCGGQLGPTPDLQSSDFDAVLLLHMAAMLAALSEESVPRTEAMIFELLLNREQRQWEHQMKARGVGEELFTIVERIAWSITEAKGAADEADAIAIANKDSEFFSLPLFTKRAILYVLRDCLSSSHAYIEPLRPDRLGAFFTSRQLEPHTDTAE
jgi:hypothetical protein